MNEKNILKTIHLEKGTNAINIEYTKSKLYIQRYADRKIYEENKDFKVINNGNNTITIIFNDVLDRSSDYNIYVESTDRA